jgi:serine/threonine-protein kinase
LENVSALNGASGSRWRIATAVLAISLAVTCATLWWATRPVDHPLTRLSVDLGPEAMTGQNLTVAISPDGRRLVYPVRGPDGKQLLATRSLDQAQPTLLRGTEEGRQPFFSPDGQWVGFYAGSQLKKISAQGGAPVTLGQPGGLVPRGGSWGEDGNIIAAMGNVLALSRMPAAGGPRQLLTKLGPGEGSHRWPQVLPGGEAVLFTASPGGTSWDNANIETFSLKTGLIKIVQPGGYYGRYLPSGHLVYVHQGVLFGERFDPARLEVSGGPTLLLEDVAANAVSGEGQFDFSNTGTFVYMAGRNGAQAWRVAWLDSSGKLQSLLATPGAYTVPRLSPDGRELAFVNGGDIYLHDLERGTNKPRRTWCLLREVIAKTGTQAGQRPRLRNTPASVGNAGKLRSRA